MTWPSSDVNTTNVDSSGDSPATARGDLYDLIGKFNLLRNHVSSFMQGVLLAVNQAAARVALGAAASGVNNDITSLTGLTTALPITEGGTGASDKANARYNLGVGGDFFLARLSSNGSPGSVFGPYSALYQSASAFNQTTGVFTAPTAGIYAISVALNAVNGNTTQGVSVLLRVNGSTVGSGGASFCNLIFNTAYSYLYTSANMSAVLSLQAGDTVDVYLNSGLSGTNAVQVGFFQGVRVS